MAYLTINGTAYLVREGQVRGRWLQFENRRRAIDASLLVDSVADKLRLEVEVTGLASAGRFFTPAEANALMTTLRAGDVMIGGDASDQFTARASDIGWVDVQDHKASPPTLHRHVSFTLEQV